MICENCNTNVLDMNNFCPDCGEKVHRKRLTLKTLVSQFFSSFLDYDNRLYKTLKHLFTKPELVINSYINGFRKNYVNVITYLSLSISLIAIQYFILKTFYSDLLIIEAMDMPKNMPFDINKINEKIYEYQSVVFIILTPFAAVASWVTFIDKRKYNIAEHVVINVYPSAQFFILWALFTALIIPFQINYNIATQYSMIALFLYMLYIFKRLYSISFLESFLRTVLYFVLYFIMYSAIVFIVTILVGIFMVSTGRLSLDSLKTVSLL